jgi:hypothetical protein
MARFRKPLEPVGPGGSFQFLTDYRESSPTLSRSFKTCCILDEEFLILKVKVSELGSYKLF